MEKNILILSAGRRVELLEIFKKSLKKNGLIKIFTADSYPNFSPACKINKYSFKLPKCGEKRYTKELLKKCIENNICVVIPTIDDELLILASKKKIFEKHNINLIISDLKLVKKSSNKLLTENIFKDLNIKYPKVYDVNNLRFPCINKPIKGSSSKNITILKSFKDLSLNLVENKKNYFSKFIRGYTEFTADLYFNKKNKLKALSVRERLDVRNGEVIKSKTNVSLTNKIFKYFEKIDGAIGPLTIQFFYNKKNKDIYGIEINPRLAGGCTLSYYAGMNFPKLVVNEYIFNESISKIFKIKKNLLLLRYDKDYTK